MDPETKRHIDGARQVLVGVVPNPVSQIDQITYALIYKFMDDMDQASLAEGGEPSFFIKDLERYAWTRLMDTRLGNQERMNLYSEAFIKFAEAEQLPELFRSILKSAFLPYRSPEVLWLFLKEIDYFDYSHPEELGNAYEYLLSIMGSQGDAGQFRTPRHIIDFIVDVIQPTENDKILDPACGTGGFLVKAYQHILEQHQGEKRLTPSQKLKLMDQFEGYDIDPGMVRISLVNMFLHNFKNPKILQYDTLSMEEKWNDRFDVIMANPPFMSPKGGIKPHSKFSVHSTRSEVLFVDYIMNHLKPKGRAGIIVPEGIIFQSGNAYKQLRKNLVNDGLYAVVSLPSGVFQPYSGVKTSILFFNNEIANHREEILFVKVDNDGFDLGATKRPITKNDLPETLEILSKWFNNAKVESQRALYVTKTKLSESGDYNLSGDRYRVTTDYSNAKWPMVELGEICDIIAGQSPDSQFYNNVNDGLPFYQGKTEFTDMYLGNPTKWTTHITKVSEKDDILISVRAPVGPVNINVNKICIGRGLAVIRSKKKVIFKFLFFLLRYLEDEIKGNQGAAFSSITKIDIEKIKIPLPPLEVQQQLVEELDSYQNIINGAKQIIANWKPRIDIDQEWMTEKLEKHIDLISGQHIDSEKYSSIKHGTPYITGPADFGDFSPMITKWTDSPKVIAKKNDILITVKGSGIGKINILYDDNVCISRQIMAIRVKDVNSIYLYYLLLLNKNYFLKSGEGSAIPGLTRYHIKSLSIPLPSIEIQQQIVERIESERVLVDSAKKLIDIYEQKIKTIISKLWEG